MGLRTILLFLTLAFIPLNEYANDTITYEQITLVSEFRTHLVIESLLIRNYVTDCKDDSVLIGNTLSYTNDTLGFMDVYAPVTPSLVGYLKWLDELILNIEL